ncbi:hypothetical protein J2X90_000685 [Variovorax paradoxus]|uniref:hypothetical protein n=1 Tax=Variovorax paradoxus TaxID=34073 RepID=UPI002780E07E|nr:hypothetical protein [Variovorax paradoxus]MDQ0022899.1 hypothetical protein [Variovorax paradoxus]
MEPINYSVDVQSPFQAALQGYQAGNAIRDDQLKQQQMALVMQQQQRQAQMLQSLMSNPNATAKDYANATLVIPQLKDNFKQAWEMRSAEQQQAGLKDMSQYYAAVASGRPDIAAQAMTSRADAMEASGVPKAEVAALRSQAEVVKQHPELARSMMGMLLASIPGGDKVISGAATLGSEGRAAEQGPADLAKKNAEAGIKTAEAGVAPQKNALEIANAAEDIETKQAQRQIAALNTQISQANSETQRGELILKRDELVQKQADKSKTEGASAQDAVDTLAQTRATVDALMKHPGLKGGTVLGGAGTLTGRALGNMPGTDDKDFRAQIETLQAQNFQSQVKAMVGMGALSDAEGKKLAAAIANLDPDQSAKQLKNNLGVVRSYIDKAMAKQVGGGKLPTTGGGFVLKHPVYGNVTEGTINQLLTKFPGSTREQVMNYLQSQGKPAGGAQGSF